MLRAVDKLRESPQPLRTMNTVHGRVFSARLPRHQSGAKTPALQGNRGLPFSNALRLDMTAEPRVINTNNKGQDITRTISTSREVKHAWYTTQGKA